MERPINPEHEALLRTATKTAENKPLPQAVVDKYWEFDRTYRRLGVRVGVDTIGLIAIMCNSQGTAEAETFLDVIKRGEVSEGDRVVANMRNKWRLGWYRGVDKSTGGIVKIKVQIDDGTIENRSLTPNRVRLPYKEELKKIGES